MHALWLSLVASMALACAYSLWSVGEALYQLIFGVQRPSMSKLITDLSRALSFGLLLVTIFARKQR